MKQLTIIGASGHGKVLADIAKHCGYEDIQFLDDDESLAFCGKNPVVGKTDKEVYGDVIVAIGNADIRKRLSNGRKLVTLIHPDAVIADDVVIGPGTVVMAGVVINPGTKIGRGCIINTSSSVDHDCVIGDYSHVSVGAHLCGTVRIGDAVWIGAGATISNNIIVCTRVLVGAGAVVVNDILESGTYIGVPAKRMGNAKKR